MAMVGYARVSSTGQSLDVQMDKLKGCSKVFKEKRSGLDGKRPELKACLEYLREGDTLVISRIDRLARSTVHLHQIAEDMKQRGVELKVIDQHIDTSTPQGKLMFSMLAAIAEFETDVRKERQADGIAKARAKGVQFGRKAEFTDEQVQEMRKKRADGELIKDIMDEFSISKAHLYRLLKAPASTPDKRIALMNDFRD